MRCEIEGELLEVQGCIERALDIITANAWKYLRIESSATREYVFSHMELGEVGKIKISILPKGRTELYSYQPELPEEKWLVEYLPSHIPLKSLSEPLRKLLSVYTWQIENNIFNLNSIELYKLAYSNTTVDWGWESYGLGDFDLRKSALDEFRNWQNKIHELQKKELEQILDVIVIQIRTDGLSMILFDGKTREWKVLKPNNVIDTLNNDFQKPKSFFRKTGNTWEILFRSCEKFYLADTLGLSYIHSLLSNPNKEINVTALEAGMTGGHQEKDFEDDLHTDGNSFDAIMDLEYKNSIQNKLRELHEERVEANARGDSEALIRIDKDTENISKFINSSSGLGGRSRRMNSEGEKARLRVRKAINNAIRKIREDGKCPDLANYLDSTIRYGSMCEYKPPAQPDNIDWILL